MWRVILRTLVKVREVGEVRGGSAVRVSTSSNLPNLHNLL